MGAQQSTELVQKQCVLKGWIILHAVSHPIVQDRIEAGTFMVAAAMTQGNVLIGQMAQSPEHNRPLISKLIEMGAEDH
jgi:UDP-N-acetylglucosamine 1-carboxyvinyltransferase